MLQTKLKISEPGDAYEQEADRIADEVMRMPEPSVQRQMEMEEEEEEEEEEEIVQRQAISGQITPLIQRQGLPEMEEDEEGMVQRKENHYQPLVQDSSIVHQVLNSPGQPLDSETRAFMESRFGQNFSQVKIHTDVKASESAKILNSLAYTVGQNIVFGTAQYAPATQAGKRLIAHELTHVVQQNNNRLPARLNRQTQTSTTPTVSPPTFGAACSGGSRDPCQYSRCNGHHTSIGDDFTRAISYVDSAVTALSATPLSSNTVRALDWYFNDHSESTARTVQTRLGCIRQALVDSQTNNRYGCHPDDDALAYVCVGSIPPCDHTLTNVCLTDHHFSRSPRVRAETMIHECAHRVGMSLGSPQSVDDIYDFNPRFLFLDTEEALLNSDSYALFAGAILNGIRTSLIFPIFGLSAGGAFPAQGSATWQGRLYLGSEFQHPILGIFNPTLGLGVSLIGETTSQSPSLTQSGSSLLASLLAGIRIGDPRPGASGGGYVSLFGGPAIAVPTSPGARTSTGLGAEAGFAVGYRWRWLDASVTTGYLYDPTRESGMEHLYTISAGLTFTPWISSFPGSH
ncbi:DUF4157 domain-containing protein [Leptothermofonsia sichuanensis E412]|uniref:eCIS core domain-containing protein n=1 Tax=Leptothermofonsia sichuanensis TaxID=2917832 RepID=UPI001CA7A7AE|nr:DUF4157 domain-containing protein [Leptothermofonsia sichuanensis]QZZ18779.1 DUF4157 domain-containing protein [Leptothermofonsia sichuanensis E412]